MRKLVASWLTAEQSYGNSTAAALRLLNERLGTKYTHSRAGQWKRGVYTPSPEALSWMLLRTLPWAIDEVGISASDEQLVSLDHYFWNPAENGNDGSVDLFIGARCEQQGFHKVSGGGGLCVGDFAHNYARAREADPEFSNGERIPVATLLEVWGQCVKDLVAVVEMGSERVAR